MINRCALIIKRKEPFRQWLMSLPEPDDISLGRLNEDTAVYLIPEYDDDKQRDRILKKVFNAIFEEELAG